ncbi:MAG: response regulator, partial [Bacteroidota bacterium]
MNKYDDAPRTLLVGWTILVVDDHEDSQEIIADILTFYGANVVFANDGKEGFAKAIEIQPKFIISDIAMPNLDGWGFIELIKGDSRTANIPTIALTAHAMVGDREK